MKVTLDFDGTIYSTCKRIIDLAKEHYPSSYKGGTFKDVREYGFKPVLDIEDSKVKELFNRKDFYVDGYFIEGALESIKEMIRKGIDVDILTVGTPFNNLNKILLLHKNGVDIPVVTATFGWNVDFDKSFYSSRRDKKELAIYIDDRVTCLDSVKNFTHIFQFREEGYVLDEDKINKYIHYTYWNFLLNEIMCIKKYEEGTDIINRVSKFKRGMDGDLNGCKY